MVGIFSRHRSLALLAGVVLAQVLLLAFQIKRDHDVRLIRYWAVGHHVACRARRHLGILRKSAASGRATSTCTTPAAENQRLRAEVGAAAVAQSRT